MYRKLAERLDPDVALAIARPSVWKDWRLYLAAGATGCHLGLMFWALSPTFNTAAVVFNIHMIVFHVIKATMLILQYRNHENDS